MTCVFCPNQAAWKTTATTAVCDGHLEWIKADGWPWRVEPIGKKVVA